MHHDSICDCAAGTTSMRMAATPTRRSALVALLLVLTCGSAAAENWPERTVRMVIPFPPGGVSDVLGRFWSQKLGAALNTSVFVENRPGGGTTIAAAQVARAAADGYTLYFTDITTHAINATLYKSLKYDVQKDFAPVAVVAASPLVLVVPASLAVSSLGDFLKLTRSKPGHYNYASSGMGTTLHLATESLKTSGGIDLLHVPYKGSAEALMATLSGQTSAAFSTIPAAVPHVGSGRFRALGVTSARRSEALPDVPPIAETLPNFHVVLYSGILAPAGTPAPVVDRINAEVSRILKEPETRALYLKSGAEPVDMKPAEFGKLLTQLVAEMGQTVKQSGANAD